MTAVIVRGHTPAELTAAVNSATAIVGSGSYIQTGTGAVTRSNQDRARDSINVKDFGALGNGSNLDGAAFISAIAAGVAGAKDIFIPAGDYRIDATLLSPYGSTTGIRLHGAGTMQTRLTWVGPVGGTMFSGFSSWQYGFALENMTLRTLATVSTPNKALVDMTSRAIFIEKAQNAWLLRNLTITGFGKGLELGVHAERCTAQHIFFGYNGTHVHVYGSQTDVFTLKNAYVLAHINEAFIMAGNRWTMEDVVCVKSTGWTEALKPDVRIGFEAVRAGDIGKSSYLTSASLGGAANYSVLSRMSFERSNAAYRAGPFIVMENIDPKTTDNQPLYMRDLRFPNQIDVPCISIRDKRVGVIIESADMHELTPALVDDEYATIPGDANSSDAASKDTLRYIRFRNNRASVAATGARGYLTPGPSKAAFGVNTPTVGAAVTLTAGTNATLTQDSAKGTVKVVKVVGSETLFSTSIAAFNQGTGGGTFRLYFRAAMDGLDKMHITVSSGGTTLFGMREIVAEDFERDGMSLVVPNPDGVALAVTFAVTGTVACTVYFDKLTFGY